MHKYLYKMIPINHTSNLSNTIWLEAPPFCGLSLCSNIYCIIQAFLLILQILASTLTIINLSRIGHHDDHFIVTTYEKYVFYIQDPKDLVILTPPPGEFYDGKNKLDNNAIVDVVGNHPNQINNTNYEWAWLWWWWW